jgi:hypothetical protein
MRVRGRDRREAPGTCRNAPDKLACMLSERVVYVVPTK